uniref:Anthranilate synthase component 2 n=1 Tax=Choreocolax polysiphoniae TaxID=282351 RepID=A0A0B5VUL3_9FLOR|nr:anthranilate synthase component 2 [Choreocolax polysiphoniae]AJH65878.1 anthranilate synthase component 2 [Choreocolax polysiphoniae]
MIIIIDNYDSFTQNLAQCIGKLNYKIIVVRNNKISIQNIKRINPTHIILSPGPGKPEQSKISLEIIKTYSKQIPILGICLGHQSIGYVFGGKIKKMKIPIHGQINKIIHNQQDLFKKLNNSFQATRYHSLIIDSLKFTKNLEITAWTSNGLIMACKHKEYQHLRGIQFHPESLWTIKGESILKNFLLL